MPGFYDSLIFTVGAVHTDRLDADVGDGNFTLLHQVADGALKSIFADMEFVFDCLRVGFVVERKETAA